MPLNQFHRERYHKIYVTNIAIFENDDTLDKTKFVTKLECVASLQKSRVILARNNIIQKYLKV